MQILLSSLETQTKTQSEKIFERKEDQIKFLYKMLKRNPFDQKSLVKLLQFEKENNNEALSHYLVNRINELKKKREWM